MKLKDIKIGKTDAKNEILHGTVQDLGFFEQSYTVPPSILLEKFYEKKTYFVLGLKGTGKTALLRYISMKLEEDGVSRSKFVLFKTEFDEEDRKDLSRAANVNCVENPVDGHDDLHDYGLVWRWFIYKQLAKHYSDGAEIFQRNGVASDFVDLVSLEKESAGTGFSRLVPKIKKGRISISQNPKFELDFEWAGSKEKQVEFRGLVKKADLLFKQLSPGGEKLNLFFDELELSFSSQKQYGRDTRLVRDLVFAVEAFNGVCKECCFDICAYAAVRSEVRNVISISGAEINKPLMDFGVDIIWHQPGQDVNHQPLLQIISNKINKSRAFNGLGELEPKALWKEYFPEKIQGDSPQRYILHNSWYRPRDIVLLLMTAQEQFPEEATFKHAAFDAIRKVYSGAVWTEMTEELRAVYRSDEIEGLESLLYEAKQVMEVRELVKESEDKSEFYPEVGKLLSRHNVPKILKDLYRVGIVGNIDWNDRGESKMRFSFRGDSRILPTQKIFIHNALRSHLSLR
ncbi:MULTISPECIES: P-loop ATPase, Sll1717 family [Halomonas]|uniref:ATPase n=1 Tax=Halomonas halophila TaxID=29573 RepID=A0ABQ0U701_9GAMM|nr:MULTISPECIES: hypothetical protein [Halomonas]MDR5891092.1 hypothetical protein [Halomonas salina]WJY08414.1 hypothetical protein QWG60_05735 [Halomonas halophila]GEK74216.1 hypothetical protein HHA04nite_27600 [Halomonas halophila]